MIKTFTVELKDQISPSAKNAAAQVKVLTTAMSGLEKAAVKAAELGNVSSFQRAASQHKQLGTEVNRLTQEFGPATEGAKQLDAATSSESMFSSLLKAEAVIRALKAIGRGIEDLGEFAIEASEHAERMTATFAALGNTDDAGGKAILGTVRELAKTLPQSERQVQTWASSLMAAGVTDMTQLRSSLQAVAGAEALVEGGEKVKGMLANLAEQSERGTKTKFSLASLAGTGVSESEFLKGIGMTPQNFDAAKKAGTITGEQISKGITEAINAKSAGPLAAMNNELGTVVAAGKDMLSHLFEGLDFSGIGEAAKDFFNLFDLANPSGQAIKAGIGGAVKWLGEVLVDAIKIGKHLFLEIELGALLAYNFLRPLVHSFIDAAESTGFLSAAWEGIKIVALGVAVGIGAVIVAAVAFGAAVVVGIAAIAAFISAIPDAIAALIDFTVKADQAIGKWVASGWNAATDFVAGMVKGIVDGTGAIVKAAENMAGSAWTAVKNTLGIHSPSTVMMAAGQNTSEGFAQGIESGHGRVSDASSGLAAKPMQAAGGSTSSSSSVSNNFDIHITAKDNATAHELLGLFEETMASLQDRYALSMGVAP